MKKLLLLLSFVIVSCTKNDTPTPQPTPPPQNTPYFTIRLTICCGGTLTQGEQLSTGYSNGTIVSPIISQLNSYSTFTIQIQGDAIDSNNFKQNYWSVGTLVYPGNNYNADPWTIHNN